VDSFQFLSGPTPNKGIFDTIVIISLHVLPHIWLYFCIAINQHI